MAKSELKRRARQMFARGIEQKVIAEALEVSQSTVSRWYRASRQEWDAARAEAASFSPDALLRDLDRELVATLAGRDLDPVARADAVGKIARAQEVLSQRFRGTDVVLDVMGRFAEWSDNDLPGDSADRDTIREAIDGFIADVLVEGESE